MSRSLWAAILCWMVSCAAWGQALDEQQEAHFRSFVHEIRCLVCQNQTIADSDAPLAQDLRAQIRKRIAAGETDSDIKRYLTDRYGDFVLYNPPLKASTLLLWAGPALLVLIALFTAWRFTRRSRGVTTAVSPDAAALKRLLDETKK